MTETRSADLVPILLESADKVRELRTIPVDKRPDTWVDDVRTATAALHADDTEYTARQRLESDELLRIALDYAIANPPKSDSRGPRAAFDELGPEHRSILQEVVDNDAYKEWATRSLAGEHGQMPELFLEGRSLMGEQRTLLDSTANGTGPSYFQTTATPRPPTPREQKFYLRDLLSVSATGLAAIPYIRELNPATTEAGASSVAESAAKPEAVMTFELDTAVAKKIAAWIPATMEILADAPTLQGYIYNRLSYMLQVRETQQVLTGNGVGADLKGIFNYSGIQTVTTATNGDPFPDLAAAIGKVENVDLDANGIVMNPVDYWTTMGLRHTTQFDGAMDGTAPFGGPAGTIWGLPVVRTRAVATLTAYVADWRMGATLWDRMQTTIRQSDSHDTYFILNKVAILAEERVALSVERPDAFVKVTIDITP